MHCHELINHAAKADAQIHTILIHLNASPGILQDGRPVLEMDGHDH